MTNPISEKEELKQYATKVDPLVKETLDLIVRIKGKGFGQRELQAEMVELYRQANPAIMDKVDQVIKLLGVSE